MVFPLQNPAPGRRITSDYGWRNHSITGNKMHRGIDFGGVFDVLAAADGKVVYVSPDWRTLSDKQKKIQTGGNVVTIQHATDCFTTYYHGDQKTHLREGDRVAAGDKIFRSGTTGAATGPHLHWEVRTKKNWGSDVDPHPYLRAGESGSAAPAVGIPVSGRLDNKTWRAWQAALKKNYRYRGIVDGKPGPLTWNAVQRSVGLRETGAPDKETYQKVQEHLKKLGYYNGPADGDWGKFTISGLQRALNDGKY